MKKYHKLVAIGTSITAFLLVVCWPTNGRAELPQKAFRLHLESGLMQIQRGEIDWDDGHGEYDIDQTAAGLGIPQFGVGLGFVIWQGLVIGGRVETAYYDSDWSHHDDSFALALLPYGEYAFLTGMFRPFVTVYLGLKGLTSDFGDNIDFSMWGFATGAGGGAHIFLMDNFSIDLTLLLGVFVGGADIDAGRHDQDGNFVLFESSILVGLSGWI